MVAGDSGGGGAFSVTQACHSSQPGPEERIDTTSTVQKAPGTE